MKEFAVWQPPECPFAVEYSTQVLEELRSYAEEWFQKIPHGGLEVGAVLFGGFDGERVQVAEWRPVPCSHARGPGFVLADVDLDRLDDLMRHWGEAPELEGLEPVGWFHTHTRSKLFLSPEDVAIYDRYFPSPWQISFVMRMAKGQPVTAGFFYREIDSSVHTEQTRLVFEVEPDPAAKSHARRKSAQPAARPLAAAARATPDPRTEHRRRLRDDADPHVPVAPPPATTAPGPETTHAPEALPEQTVREIPLAAAEQPDPPFAARHLPDRELPEETARTGWWRIPAAAAVLLVAALGAWSIWKPAPPTRLLLRAESAGTQLVITWDYNSEAARQADHGTLEVTEGGAKRQFPLDADMSRRGAVTYVRKSGDVQMRLVLYRGTTPLASDSVRFSGTAPAQAAAAPDPGAASANSANEERSLLERQREQLQQALTRQQERNRTLRQELARER